MRVPDVSLPMPDTSALIAALPQPGLRRLAAIGQVRSFSKNAVIISEGDVADTVYLTLAGRVRVYHATEDGREVVLDVLGPGELIGEMVLDGSPRSASIMTVEPCSMVVMTVSTLREQLRNDPDLALLLIAELMGRLRRRSQSLKQLALGDVYQRLAALLSEVGGSQRPAVIEGLTQQELADRIGASRDTVNRIFKELINGGFVEVARRRITLLRPLPAHW
jgi:CRP/FNR family cyclic AMP-dependent transcriptional regulator